MIRHMVLRQIERNRSMRLVVMVALACCWIVQPVNAQGPPQTEEEYVKLFESISWQQGPTHVLIGDVAEMDIPVGTFYTGREGAVLWNSHMGDPPKPSLVGLLISDQDFFMNFDYVADGHILDNERVQIEDPSFAPTLLKIIQDATEQDNQWRRERGFTDVTVKGWMARPEYDSMTHLLCWAIRGMSSSGASFVNYNTRVLGRRGYLTVTMVSEPNDYDKLLPVTQQVITGVSFRAGERYDELQPGDKIATYGLIGLISGVGTSAAIKSGLMQKFGKLIIAALAALGGLGAWAAKKWDRLKKWFSRSPVNASESRQSP